MRFLPMEKAALPFPNGTVAQLLHRLRDLDLFDFEFPVPGSVA